MIDEQRVRQAASMLLDALGIQDGDGLDDTPQRVARMYVEIFSGLDRDPLQELTGHFSEEYDETVVVRDIPFYSMCEHHLVPFFGKAHVAYRPSRGLVIGLGKLAAAVEIYARRPQLQERMTRQIAESIEAVLQPEGVMVMVEAEHMCMTMRGVNKPGTKAVTTAVCGVFASDAAARAEAMAMMKP